VVYSNPPQDTGENKENTFPTKRYSIYVTRFFFVSEKFAEYVLKLPPTPPSVRGSGRPFILMALMALRWWW
jgi:hypothetical protein